MVLVTQITVYLSSYNGEKFLDKQIDSILNQRDVLVNLVIRDDGSSDKTCELLKQYRSEKRITILKGKNLGYAKSFLSMVKSDRNEISDYYAFSDQDDIWLPQKLKCGIKQLQHIPQDVPALYVSALQRVDENLNKLDKQNFPHLILSLGAEFTRHRLAGCTFVFNKCMKRLLERSGNLADICSHDALATMICLSCGGKVIYDSNSYILFRRHDHNTSVDGKGMIFKVYHDIKKFILNKHQHRDLAKRLCGTFSADLTSSAISFLQEAANYDKSITKTIQFAFNKQLGCGYWYYDFFIRTMILLRYY